MWLPAGTNQHRDRFLDFRERKSLEYGRPISISGAAAIACGMGLDLDEKVTAGRLTLSTIGGDIVSFCSRWQTTTGYSRSETLAQEITYFLDPLPTRVEITLHQATLKRKGEQPIDCRVTSRFMSDGSVVWLVDLLGG